MLFQGPSVTYPTAEQSTAYASNSPHAPQIKRAPSNWRDHLINTSASPTLHKGRYQQDSSINYHSTLATHGASPSLSSSSDQKSVGEGPPPFPSGVLPVSKQGSYKSQQNQSEEFEHQAAGKPSFSREAKKEDNVENDDDMSDWEKEISETGDVFYVVPYLASENEVSDRKDYGQNTNNPELKAAGYANDSSNGGNKTGKKLSRLVRRRESKKDRNGYVPSSNIHPMLPAKSRLGIGASGIDLDDSRDSKRKTISLLPGGNKSNMSGSSNQQNNR